MRTKILAVLLSAPFLSGCYVIAPFPGGYVGFDVPVEVRASTNVTVQWDMIPGTTIYYSPSYPDILYYGGSYYYVVNGMWYMGPRYTGPWRVQHNVPDVFLYIPPTHPEFRLVPWHPRYHEFMKGHTPGYYPAQRGVEEPGFRRDDKNVPPGQIRHDDKTEPPGQIRRDEAKGPIVTPPPHGGTITPPPQTPHNPPPPQKNPAPQPPKEPKKDKPEKEDKDKNKEQAPAEQPQPAPFHRR